MPVAEDLKRARFGDALKDIATEKSQIIRLLVILLAEYTTSSTGSHYSGPKNLSKERAEKVLRDVASLLVEESSAKDFIPVLHCMTQSPSMVFGNIIS